MRLWLALCAIVTSCGIAAAQPPATESIDEALTTFKERDRVVGLDDWQKIERQYLAVDPSKS